MSTSFTKWSCRGQRAVSLLVATLTIVAALLATATPVRAAEPGAVVVGVWSCPPGTDPTSTDQHVFAAACKEPVDGMRFSLSHPNGEGRPLIRLSGVPITGEVSWNQPLNGNVTISLVEAKPGFQPAAFCQDGGTWKRQPVTDGLTLLTNVAVPAAGISCQWYFVPNPPPTATPTPTLTPTSTPSPTLVSTNVPVLIIIPISTETLIPSPTATKTPTDTPTTVPEETPDAAAIATTAQEIIDASDADYALVFPGKLIDLRGDQYKVYPDLQYKRQDDYGMPVGDFVVEAVFENPTDVGSWSYGFLFGPGDEGEFSYLAVRADGQWELVLGSTNVGGGSVEGLNVAAGESNTLRLIVNDGRGVLYVNDTFAADVAISDMPEDGKLWLATDVLDGDEITFLTVSVWCLPETCPQS
jgi:hypothetical protein